MLAQEQGRQQAMPQQHAAVLTCLGVRMALRQFTQARALFSLLPVPSCLP